MTIPIRQRLRECQREGSETIVSNRTAFTCVGALHQQMVVLSDTEQEFSYLKVDLRSRDRTGLSGRN